MRRIFILTILCLAIVSSGTIFAKGQGQQLNDLLLSYMKVEDVHPDSLERNIADLKQQRLKSVDSATRAVYAAAIARLYAERMMWRSVGNDLRDSMITWYSLSLADKQVLAQTKAKRWKPFVVVGKDESYFKGDMLNVVWRSMVNDVDKAVRDTAKALPKYGEMVNFYQKAGLREGAFLMAFDSLYDKHEKVTEADLLLLRDRYADLPICAEIYLKLGLMTKDLPGWKRNSEEELAEVSQAAQKARKWLQEGLTKYPKYKRRAALQNALTSLSNPFMEWDGPTCVSPNKQYTWYFTARNVQSVLIDGKEHIFPEHDPVDTFRDSLTWTSPKPGRYNITFIPRTKAKITEKVKPLKTGITVTTIQPAFQVMPDSSVRVLVVNPETGRPQPNVTITAYKPTDEFKDTVAYFTGSTGTDGKVTVPRYKGDDKDWRWRQSLTYKICSPDTADWILGTRFFYNISRWEGAPKEPSYHTELFTDRAIYRPGQTVHVSGIEYSQLDWEAKVVNGGRHTLRLYDSNHKQIEERIVDANEMGVFTAEFVIPTGRRNGSFHIEADKKYRTYFRVEEYKRPTFEVVLDDSLYVNGDSCEVRGSAMNYDGSPLHGARVTGAYTWRAPWIYYAKRYPNSESLPLDTIETDDNGRFIYKLRIKSEIIAKRFHSEAEKELRIYRPALTVNVDVLSQQGETHNAQHWYWRVNEPAPKAEPAKIDSSFILRCEPDSFAVGKPARIKILTNLSDIYLFYTLSAAGKVWKDEMVRLNHGTLVIEIPYREEYDQSLTASFYFAKEGRVYTDTKTIHLVTPDSKLRAHWDTFRDLVQPGQKEEWRLTLRRPDGTPADANLMLAMYDASLDYFTKHQWRFEIGRGHRTFGIPFQPDRRIDTGTLNFGGWYSQKLKKERELNFTTINGDLFQAPVYTRGMGRPVLYKSNSTMRLAGVMAAPSSGADFATDEALQGSIAGLTLKETVAELEGTAEAEEETLSVPMRENFNETAFFMPQLRTNKDGQVIISFTLPESLTRWNLLGVAHTSDMMYANISEQIEARKDLMAQLYLPRFLRPGDEAILTASVRNIGEQPQKGKGLMQILDAKTEKVLKQWKCNIDLPTKKDTIINYQLSIVNFQLPEGLIVRWAVEGTTCSDGEQRLLPVLSPTEHVTRTIPITAYDPGVTNMDLTKLFPEGVTERQLTVEYTTHPEQYALQTLPTLAKAKREDVLSIAAAYYAGELGKALNVEMPDSTEEYRQKLQALQDADGGFRWYPQMPTSPYLTREVSYLLTRLRMLTNNSKYQDINDKAVRYLLAQRIDSTYFSTSDLRNLYIALWSGVSLSKDEQKKVDFLLRLAKKAEPEEMGYEGQALLALVWNKAGEQKKAQKCVNLFKKYLVSSPEHGSYIEFPKGSFVSVDRKLHIHVQLMEALQKVMPEENKLLGGMRRYLLQQKRTQEWSTPVNSANAIFALLTNAQMVNGKCLDLLTLTDKKGKTTNFIPKDEKLGYLRDTMEVDDKHLPKNLRLHKFSKDESWGAVFADFEQPFADVTAYGEGLTIRQEYPQEAKKGSRYKVRYYLSADRDYEYVTLVVPRPAFTEPVDVRSGYRWGGGLGYYRQVHDATTEFSFCQIPRGEYLIEETLYVERDGKYHSGIAVIRCDYADEFQGHSADDVVVVKN